MPSLVRRTTAPNLFVETSILGITDPATMEGVPTEFLENGLVAAHDNGAAAIICATEGGDIDVSAELWDGPATLRVDDWQDVAELSLDWPTTQLRIGDDGPQLTLTGPGRYRLRVHGMNRDEGDVREDGDPVETYLIQIWPAPIADPVILKATSLLGETYRGPQGDPEDDPGHIHGMSYDDIAAQRRSM